MQLVNPFIKRGIIRPLAAMLLVVVVASCGFGVGHRGPSDGAPSVRLDPDKIDNAVPRVEQTSRGGNKSPYKVFGKKYYVMPSADGFKERGQASWYGKKFHGNPTSNGERYDMYQMTAAHKTLPIPTYVKVTNLENGKQVIVRVNDRGPFHGGRIIDLSYAAATKIGMLQNGVARVEVEAIDAREWQRQARLKQQGKATASRATKQPVAQSPVTQSPVTQSPVTQSPVTTPPVTKQATKALAQAAADDSSDRLYLQIGAYSNLDAAQSIQNRLINQLAYNVVIHPTANTSPIYRVRIGPLPSTSAIDTLKNNSALDAFEKMVRVIE